MVEESTLGLMSLLTGDVERCRASLAEAVGSKGDDDESKQRDAEFHARQLFRATFAFFEAVTFSTKLRAAAHLIVFGPAISDAELFLAKDQACKVKNSGEIKMESARIRFADNIRFAIMLTERAKGKTKTFDANTDWWSCLISSIKVRDRLTHPKNPGDCDLIAQEVTNLLKAYYGFNEYLNALPKYPPIPVDKVDFL
jgi:hypothetical protein